MAKKRKYNRRYTRPETGTKYCPGCGRQLDVSQFGTHTWNTGGLRSVCKECHRVRRPSHRLKEAPSLTDNEWQHILLVFDNKCAYCGDPYEEMEHFISIVDGGGHNKYNVVPACAECNKQKMDKTPEEFFEGNEQRMMEVMFMMLAGRELGSPRDTRKKLIHRHHPKKKLSEQMNLFEMEY